MKTLVVAALPLLALAVPAAAAEQSFMVTGFEEVAASGPHKIIVTTGKTPSVRAVGTREDIDKLDIKVTGRTLRIGQKKQDSWLSWSKDGEPVTIYVNAASISGARLAGSGDMAVDRMNGDDVKLSIAGSGDLNVGVIKAGKLDVSVAGSGDIAMTGTCTDAAVSIAGSGNVEAAGLKCESMTGKVAGSGNIKADVSKTATLKVAGSGDITITGNAKCDIKTLGSGRVRCGSES